MPQDAPGSIRGRAPKLINGSGHIDYCISKVEQGICLRLIGNDAPVEEPGTHTKELIYLWRLIRAIVDAGNTFKSADLKDVLPAGNNNPGFVIAVLKDMGLVVGEYPGPYRLRCRPEGG